MIALDAEHNTLSFVPSKSSYFFESVPCIDAAEEGYGAISFRMKAPLGASFALELQTKENCGSTEYKSTWHYMGGFSGETEQVVIPLSSFAGAKTSAIEAFNWATWEFYKERDFIWTLGDIELICNSSDQALEVRNDTAGVV
ncbi:hypothetical protein F4820DRAFT_427415 [Hypoxylon rubiginosum]|uniref:Uncharacterized protein n=1 Tax=Hypoxylon rubiginosum TaxID=110542 RepID=A0ACB9YVB7_9PEZI|nr:hypothetical protein F4820DRAFT_427415 [Hypoxylon rubiginosum]